jgi:hypothetical protein
VQRRVQFRRYVLGRLRAYYAKKVFQLASETYNQQLQLTGKATV